MLAPVYQGQIVLLVVHFLGFRSIRRPTNDRLTCFPAGQAVFFRRDSWRRATAQLLLSLMEIVCLLSFVPFILFDPRPLFSHFNRAPFRTSTLNGVSDA